MTAVRVNPTKAQSIADQGNANYAITVKYGGNAAAASDWACMWRISDGNPQIATVAVGDLVARALKYSDANMGNVTIPTAGYVTLTNLVPSAAASAVTKVSALITNWSSNTGAVTPVWNPNNGAFYVIGSPGTNITSLNVRFWYI